MGGDNRRATSEPADFRDSWLLRTPIAHRGLHAAHDGRPENSLAAFAHACALGFPAELDVRLTRDGQVVVFHDRSLRRLTRAAGRVEERDAAEIRALRLLGTGERVPLLREVLELVDGRVPLLVELKSSPLWPALEPAVIATLDGYRGEVAIQSFKRRALRELGRNETPHAVGHLWRWPGRPRSEVPAAFVACPVDRAPSRAVRRRRDSGGIVLAWTVRSADQAERVLRFVDNYIFEGFVPELAAAHPVSAPESAARASR